MIKIILNSNQQCLKMICHDLLTCFYVSPFLRLVYIILVSSSPKSADPSLVGVSEFMLLSLLSLPNFYPLLPTLCNSRYYPILSFSYALMVL